MTNKEMAFKEMQYSATLKKSPEILASGEINGYKFAIINLGTHPTAYVECKLADAVDYCDKRFDNIDVHGGFTYFDKSYWDNDTDTKYIGWDYSHCYDYSGYYEYDKPLAIGTKKWTTSEIFGEVMSVIYQLMDLCEIVANGTDQD